ncbi:DNA double-strand break repair nuclease NurA [Natronoarchaeum philippinense]|uniref:DNA double-strand break repair nuclease NurA n=1 Tax=Natronoarchaeum philippinense TaxID=558529 RepID=UPI000BE38392|nr:DNA double-strand break repair nuclease NurA [Natronoarchaeum philippinense]
MTLDPVHFEGITQLARRITQSVDETDQTEFVETVWDEFLDPLVDDDGRTVLCPLGEQRRCEVPIEDVALRDAEYPTCHGLDSGTINPTTFKNGLVLDVAQAAMASTPSELDLHRDRTVVITAHTNDRTTDLDDGWTKWDEGHTDRRILQAPRVSSFEESVVHELSLYLAESHHAIEHAESVSDLFVLDGPIYPKGMLNWADRAPELANLLYDEEEPRDVIANYVELVETFADRQIPLVGFVKNPSTKAITRALRASGREAPWVNDTAFFTKVLEQVEFADRTGPDGETYRERERRTDVLTFTNWFRSRGGADRLLAADADAFGVERTLDPVDYEVTFFPIYDPRDDLLYRVEAPYAFTKNAECRERLAMQLLRDVAAERGPPLAVEKADELARIGADETESLRTELEATFATDRLRSYNDRRWGVDAPAGEEF